MNGLFWAMTGLLLILGAAQLWEMIVIRWYRPKFPLIRYELLPLDASTDCLEQLLDYVSLTSSASKVIIVDTGLNDEGRELCRRFCEEHSGFSLLSKDEAKSELFCADFPPQELESEKNP